MGSEWREALLGEVVDLLSGYPFKSQHYTNDVNAHRLVGGDNIVQGHLRWENVRRWPRHMVEGLDSYWLATGDVVLAMDRPWIEAGLKRATISRYDLPALLVQRTARLRGTPSLDAAFLRYVIGSLEFTQYVLAVQTGTAVPHISPAQIRAFRLLLPPLQIQQTIAHILGTLDDKIELNRRMSETLEAMARTLFKSWFVDFDPVRAKAEGRQPSGMDAETAKLFPDAFAMSELGEVPREWKAAPLGEWATALSGGTPSKGVPSLWGGDLPWISPKVMTEIHADDADDFVTPEAVGNGTRVAPAGSTLVMVRGMGLHHQVRVSQARHEVTFNQDVKALVPKGIEPSLLLFAMLNAQGELLGRVESSGHGTGKLPSEILLKHAITMPPAQVQRRLAEIFNALNDRIACTRAEARTLATTRDGLLPRLLSGELDIDGIGIEMSTHDRV